MGAALLLAAMAVPVGTAQAAAPVRYEVTLLPESRSLYVEVDVQDVPELSDWLKTPAWQAVLDGEETHKLEPTLISRGPKSARFAYSVPVAGEVRSAYEPSFGTGFRGAAFRFLTYPDPKPDDLPVDLCIRVPEGWSMSSTLGPMAACGRSTLRDVWQTAFIATTRGRLQTTTFTVGKSQAVIAQTADYAIPAAIVQRGVGQLLVTARDYLQDEGPPLIFVALDQMPPKVTAPGVNFTSSSASSTVLLDDGKRGPEHFGYWGTIAHELLHTWVPHVFEANTLGSIFSEGFTNYLGYRIARQSGLHSEAQFLQAASNYFVEYSLLSQPAYASQRGAMGYSQGMLAALVLDASLLQSSKGRVGLREFMRTLIDRYRGKELTHDQLRALMQELGGPEAAANYIRLMDPKANIDWRQELAPRGIVVPVLSPDQVKAAFKDKTNVLRLAPRRSSERKLWSLFTAR
jgi:hypothetical protein